MTFFITGATGHLGGAVAAELGKLVPTEDIRVGVHTPSKAAGLRRSGFEVVPIDFADQGSLVSAFDGVDVLIYIASKSHDSFSRVTELENVISAAQADRVGHVVSMGFMADQVNNPFDLSAFYGYLPRRLASSSLVYTILRNGLYADPLVPYLPELIERGNVIYPVGDQALSFISLRESARAFARVAVAPELLENGRIYTLTQDRSYTMPQLAEVLSEVSGETIGYAPVSSEEFEHLYDEGGEGHMLASMYQGGALGLLGEVSDDFERITGKLAMGLTEFLRENLRRAK
ncbi:MAG: SDR family oxidoreductase [Bifidobacteriaceae bacterium]|jgi:uncharacterized protein YbjT (DUF2867 family)|nr:SDR family oxidoreductase [Bifidobacteriaceae bacterium]MCI1915338.1 SDR family oxidoreductase [Bifidobacteriaceae bacterium]